MITNCTRENTVVALFNKNNNVNNNRLTIKYSTRIENVTYCKQTNRQRAT